jgi:septum formation protein
VIIAADTVVVLDGKVLGKPLDEDDARRILKALSGRAHSVVTGFTVLDAASGGEVSESVRTEVRFRQIEDGELDRYVKTGEPMDKAGAYGIQGGGAAFVEGIEGDRDNVIGLPIGALIQCLEKFGIKPGRTP